MQIAERSVVSFHYTLTNDVGEVLDSSSGGQPLTYLHGAGNIVPGLEQAMNGRTAGDQFSVTVEPEQAYGLRDESMLQIVPRAAFQGMDTIEVGMQFQTPMPQGTMLVTVSKVDGDNVTIDGNHPLASQALNFTVEIINVRDASVEEVMHGHVHGEGGHHH